MTSFLSSQPKNENKDIVSALISNLGVLLQIIGVSLVGISDAFGITKVFLESKLLGVMNFFIFISTFSLIATYTFIKDNVPFNLDINADKTKTDKKVIVVSFVLSTVFFVCFIISTYLITRKSNGSLDLLGLLQILSYTGVLISGTFNIYIWIRDTLSKRNQFNLGDFLPNFIGSLREYGYLNDPKVEIIENQNLSTSYHLVSFRIQKEDIKSVVTSYDGKIIYKELTDDERVTVLKG